MRLGSGLPGSSKRANQSRSCKWGNTARRLLAPRFAPPTFSLRRSGFATRRNQLIHNSHETRIRRPQSSIRQRLFRLQLSSKGATRGYRITFGPILLVVLLPLKDQRDSPTLMFGWYDETTD